ncbi:MAG: ABC transporter permease subunit [Rhodobacteraceae bacterium]|nr:ABC transporter permease subunit [Paracoccaceae bacterium]
MNLSPLNRRRLSNFRANTRALWSLRIFVILFGLSLFAELIANDRPLIVSYQGELYSPFLNTYTDAQFGGDFQTEAQYKDPDMQCLIVTGGLESCFDAPETVLESAEHTGWILWPLIPYSFNTVDTSNVKTAPGVPDTYHWLGTDDQARDVGARIIYGFRISILFAFAVTIPSAALGILAGALQGYYGGWVDLLFQRFTEIWGSLNMLYLIIIIAAIFTMNFWLFVGILVLFGWNALDNVVRAEFFRARNFEYVRAAKALGVRDRTIMFRHVLPNAMVATLTIMPFMIIGAIGSLTTLDFLGYGLPGSYPSLGELALQAKAHITSPWLAGAAFFTIVTMTSLLVFIFEGIRDAFDPRKVFS